MRTTTCSETFSSSDTVNQLLTAVHFAEMPGIIHVVTPSGGGGKVRAWLTMREQKASPIAGPGGSNGPGGSELSYYKMTQPSASSKRHGENQCLPLPILDHILLSGSTTWLNDC